MRNDIHPSRFVRALVFAAALIGAFALDVLVTGSATRAQVSGAPDVNISQEPGFQNECSIIKNPSNKLQLFAACNNEGPGLFAARSDDLGVTWTYPDPVDKTLADGDTGQGDTACCDPTLAWDTFGNLYLGYIDPLRSKVEVLISTDSGATFTHLETFRGSVDQPTIVAANTSAPGVPVAVWVVFNQAGQMRARGAAVTGLGMVGPFGVLQTIPGTEDCSFGDIAIAPTGVVVQVCQNPVADEGPGTILVNTDADGLGLANFGPAVVATTTNVGGIDLIPAQSNLTHGVDAEAGLAFDANPLSPHFGRLYLVYTEEVVDESNDTDIMVRTSDDEGATWSAAIRVNDDPAVPIRSQFLPRIASNTISGNIAVCWHDARNSATNTTMEEYCDIATPTGATPTFLGNGKVGDIASAGTGATGQRDIQFGDYSGMTYFQGVVHPIWAGVGANSTATTRYEAYTDRVTGGAAATEGEPHIKTLDGIHYDFQSVGEFVALRGEGLEIQTRQAPIATSLNPGPNPHTGLATCVSLNTAVAALVGTHRVSLQPNISGVPDPTGMQLRVDGSLTTLGAPGLDLGSGGRIMKSAVGGGFEITFPTGTTLIATPGWWASKSVWYLNVNVYHTLAAEGTIGAIAKDSWLPALPDGTSLGPQPAAMHDRYVVLNEKFTNAWRVTDSTSLFDYAPGLSTAKFTFPAWPPESPPCSIPETPQVRPLEPEIAQQLCSSVEDKHRHANCVFDVTVTGERGFAETYMLTQKIEAGATTTTVNDDDPSRSGESVTFTATVVRMVSRGSNPTGTIQFSLDGSEVGKPVELDKDGRATWTGSDLTPGKHWVAADYMPSDTALLASRSLVQPHTVGTK